MITPDTVIGTGIAAAALAGWAAFELGIRLAVTRPAALEPKQETDDVAVARAMGVYVDTRTGGRSSGQMAAAIAHHATPRPVLSVVTDHDVCDECGGRLCNDTPLCPEVPANGNCPHERTLCAVCVPTCRGCRLDLIGQGALSFYSPWSTGPWTPGGAA